MPQIRSMRGMGRAKATMFSGMLQTRKLKRCKEPCEWGTDSRALRRRHRSFFFMLPKKGTRGGIEAGKMQLTRVKSRERGRDFNFVLDGEVINRYKIIGKKWQGRVLRQKLEKGAKQVIRRWITCQWTRWQRNSRLKIRSASTRKMYLRMRDK